MKSLSLRICSGRACIVHSVAARPRLNALRIRPAYSVRPQILATASSEAVTPATEAEEEANKKRWEESGGSQGSADEWRWTLNWNTVTDYPIIIGSCPRSTSDVDRICSESGATAILSLQSDVCLDAMAVSFPPLKEQAIENGVMYVRVPMMDFSHDDQSAMLPEAVRMLGSLLAMNKKVYVHCTAGINRASLTVLGYLTFIKGLELDHALHIVRSSRSQAHPYVDCWWTVRNRMLENRSEEVVRLAKSLFLDRKDRGETNENAHDDWVAAENLLIKNTFGRYVAHNLSLVSAVRDVAGISDEGKLLCYTEDEAEALAVTVAELQEKAKADRAALERAWSELEAVQQQLEALQGCGLDEDPEGCKIQVLKEAQDEITSLRVAISSINERTAKLLKESPLDSFD